MVEPRICGLQLMLVTRFQEESDEAVLFSIAHVFNALFKSYGSSLFPFFNGFVETFGEMLVCLEPQAQQ